MTDDAKAARLKSARERHYETAVEAARSHGWTPSTYLGHENGSRGFKDSTAVSYARAFKVSPEWLAFGRGKPNTRTVRIAGKVGAGAVVLPIGDDPGDWTQTIESPPDFLHDGVALVIDGDSQSPVYQEGDVVIIEGAVGKEDADGLECVVELADGRQMLKRVHLQRDGLVTLESYNAPLLLDQVVSVFHPVAWTKRARRKRS